MSGTDESTTATIPCTILPPIARSAPVTCTPVAVISNLPGDRKAWLVAMLDLPATDPARYRWERVAPADQDAMSPTRRLRVVVAGVGFEPN